MNSMSNKMHILGLVLICSFLSCVTPNKRQETHLTSAEPPSTINGQHRIVYGKYSPPELDIKDFRNIFGDKKIVSWKKISGGFSGAHLYQVDVEGHQYIVRSTGGIFGKAGIEQEVALMQQASEHNIAPKVYYANPANGVVAMDKITSIFPNMFAPGLLQSWPDFLVDVARIIREVHNLKADQKIVTERYLDVYFYDFVKHIKKDLLPPQDAAILEKFAKKKWPRGKRVLSHNDLHTRNLLNDGKKLFLIDWEFAGFGPKLFDPAIFANMQAMTNDQGRDFLNLYLQRPASHAEYFEFVAMRQLQAMMHAVFNLLGAQQSVNNELQPLHGSSPPQTVRNFLLASDSGLLDFRNPHHLYENGLVLLRYADYFK